MSESAWELIVKSYEQELKNAKTPEEKARWQAAIDASLNETNKEIIISEGSIKSTRQEKAAQKAAKIERAKNKKALEDVPGLIEEGKITYFPGHRQPDSNEAELLQSQFSQEREAQQARPKRISQDIDALAAAEDESNAMLQRDREARNAKTSNSANKPAPKTVNATNARTAEERQAILDSIAARRQAAIDAGSSRSNTPKPAPNVPQGVLNGIDRRQAAIDRARDRNQQKKQPIVKVNELPEQVYDGVPDFETPDMVGADWTPLDDFAENFEDDFVENFEDNPFHAVDDALPTEKRLAKVDQIGKDLAAEAEAKAKKRAQKNAERAENIRKDLEITKKERIEQILNREPHPGEAINARIKSGEISLEDLSMKEYSQWENLLADQANEHGGFSTMHGSKPMVSPSTAPKVVAGSVPPTKITPFRAMVGRANARGMSALEDTMDLVADISHNARTSNTTGAIGDFIPQTISNLKPVVENIKAHSTSKLIIKNMKEAQAVVANMSNKKRAAIGVGSLAAIGAASNRKLKERRG
jgi:hypothetical protein